MVSKLYDYHNPVCDFCGMMLGAEKSAEAAEDSMRREGWQKRSGKDACRVCLRKEAETGRLPERRRWY